MTDEYSFRSSTDLRVVFLAVTWFSYSADSRPFATVKREVANPLYDVGKTVVAMTGGADVPALPDEAMTRITQPPCPDSNEVKQQILDALQADSMFPSELMKRKFDVDQMQGAIRVSCRKNVLGTVEVRGIELTVSGTKFTGMCWHYVNGNRKKVFRQYAKDRKYKIHGIFTAKFVATSYGIRNHKMELENLKIDLNGTPESSCMRDKLAITLQKEDGNFTANAFVKLDMIQDLKEWTAFELGTAIDDVLRMRETPCKESSRPQQLLDQFNDIMKSGTAQPFDETDDTLGAQFTFTFKRKLTLDDLKIVCKGDQQLTHVKFVKPIEVAFEGSYKKTDCGASYTTAWFKSKNLNFTSTINFSLEYRRGLRLYVYDADEKVAESDLKYMKGPMAKLAAYYRKKAIEEIKAKQAILIWDTRLTALDFVISSPQLDVSKCTDAWFVVERIVYRRAVFKHLQKLDMKLFDSTMEE